MQYFTQIFGGWWMDVEDYINSDYWCVLLNIFQETTSEDFL